MNWGAFLTKAVKILQPHRLRLVGFAQDRMSKYIYGMSTNTDFNPSIGRVTREGPAAKPISFSLEIKGKRFVGDGSHILRMLEEELQEQPESVDEQAELPSNHQIVMEWENDSMRLIVNTKTFSTSTRLNKKEAIKFLQDAAALLEKLS